ncbi:hypothetical protein GIB67_016404 [Kingdonia uniflora]|uniref:Uncharacterized protein n=1 Tax=Kingdonia uniflora TaxID=39325 RepID=A0A7J7MH66_9MAGN|nr:hypothetical protein GIB67_016404 [Kingdonia uniflora]
MLSELFEKLTSELIISLSPEIELDALVLTPSRRALDLPIAGARADTVSRLRQLSSPEVGIKQTSEGKETPGLVEAQAFSRDEVLEQLVVGAYFEKTGSKAFTVYSIAVTNAENKTLLVKRSLKLCQL